MSLLLFVICCTICEQQPSYFDLAAAYSGVPSSLAVCREQVGVLGSVPFSGRLYVVWYMTFHAAPVGFYVCPGEAHLCTS